MDQDSNEQRIEIPYNISFQNFKKIYLNQSNHSNNTLKSLIDGEKLQDHESPESREMEEGDVIEVFQEQVGGGHKRLLEKKL